MKAGSPSFPGLNPQSCVGDVLRPSLNTINRMLIKPTIPLNTTKTVKLETLLSKFNPWAPNTTQTYISPFDQYTLHVVSDALSQSITCGSYSFYLGTVVDFRGSSVPCKNYLLLTFMRNVEDNTGFTVRVPCNETGPQHFDFKVRKTGYGSELTTDILNIPQTDESFITFNAISEASIDESNDLFSNKEALFSLSLEVFNTSMNATIDYQP